jgi:nucleotide-binding universal stress UspA family protein
MYNRILVPIDGSSASLKGLDEAIRLAKSSGAKLKLMHVVNEMIMDSPYAPAFASSLHYDQLIASLREAGQQVLAAAQSRAREQDVAVEVELTERIGGHAADSIVAVARQWPAELIVMGTHGRRGLRRLAMGSDAELVLRCSHVPVLMVRDVPET